MIFHPAIIALYTASLLIGFMILSSAGYGSGFNAGGISGAGAISS